MIPNLKIRKSFLFFIVAINIIFFIIYFNGKGSIRFSVKPSDAKLSRIAKIDSFTLTKTNGEVFSFQELLGSPWIANFIFTRCPNQCPAMITTLAKFQKIMPPNLKIISITVDPSFDSPKILEDFAIKHSAISNQWLFLTGEKSSISAIMKNMKIGDGGEPSLHSLRFTLIDKDGYIRGYYDSEDGNSLKKMLQDVRNLERAHE